MDVHRLGELNCRDKSYKEVSDALSVKRATNQIEVPVKFNVAASSLEVDVNNHQHCRIQTYYELDTIRTGGSLLVI
jgi:hypothetical protein